MKEIPENGYKSSVELDKMLPKDEKDALSRNTNVYELTDDTSCGIGCLRGAFLQKFANKTAYVVIYGMLGTLYSATFSYFAGTISTMERRFNIPSRNTGIITVGNDITEVLLGGVLGYYAGKRHRPRFIALGIYTVVIFCFLNALPHFLYGAGESAEALTEEFGSSTDPNYTRILVENELKSKLCQDGPGKCNKVDGKILPQVILFVSQLVAGVGGALYGTLGITYMDDNTQKSKTPMMISVSYFLRTLGPAVGLGISSVTMRWYISPTLTPTITQNDPRWLGAWWIGWLILAVLLFIMGTLVAFFPKELPESAHRKKAESEKQKILEPDEKKQLMDSTEEKTSFSGMIKTFKRLARTPILLCNYCANIFFFFGYSPYYYFLPKYMENIYAVSASDATLLTGIFGLGCSALGLLISGIVITKFKPKARYLSGWNVFSGAVIVMGLIGFSFLGCPDNEVKQSDITINGDLDVTHPCNENCNCESIKFSPVCHQRTHMTYISPCHAGCSRFEVSGNVQRFFNCTCIPTTMTGETNNTISTSSLESAVSTWDSVISGKCPVDCQMKFYMFLGITCINKFIGATARASNFLISVRSVNEEDKSVSIGLGMTLYSLFSFIPSPIMFGFLIDKTCLVWGKTCEGSGNCWLYDNRKLKNLVTLTSAGCVFVGLLFDLGVWFYSKNLKIFEDEEEEEKPKKNEGVGSTTS